MIDQAKGHVEDARRYDRNTLRLVVASMMAILLVIALVVVVVVQDFSLQADNHALLLELQSRHSTTETVLGHLLQDEKTTATDNAYFRAQVQILEAQQATILAELKKLGA